MPGLSGLDLAKRLESTQPRMRVLFVSGYSDEDTTAFMRGNVAASYLQKPFRPSDLARKVAELMARPS